ncbi:NAD(P)/FAD-dependent oxidoreductase [Sulfurospirillum diekertiae]|uniref:tRNA 5-methylaminomethyl-2-thiouridine biosynthesis bifunctional protein MnmC n=1 Tax=Sulfurospirillum diekertiae TaxID=1854492 RepID=A0A1Y0HIK2_9BACT|nr:NAD(P)/FAD-dependent oxidoreductase [Sulfurospirillum diekertiae]ARU47919.1 tRNA 5-methylaminomethyl-2-thiouridine biosynthesis bifunctional protein MnmC [Sulfurospirillum diekertiae]ASC92765.1 tRNA 5-methylaminomethyl-2-thiouridine biosynthesis bifunctional protein MnmC [Sulfurospirillum diekertiae]
MSRIAIIGAGASGLVCAIEASRKGHNVTLFEKNSKVGRKILATGNGKCNISNEKIQLERYHGKSPSFAKEALKRFDTFTCKAFFRSLGLEMREGEEGRLYPMSHQASSVVDMLLHEVRSLHVNIVLECEVTKIEKKDAAFVLHVNEKTDVFDACVIATGSVAMPTLGSSGSGYGFAKSLGHSVIEPYPSLVQFVCDESHLKEVSGVKMDANVELYIDNQKCQSVQGDLLFTAYGLSGSAILDLSRKASHALVQGESVDVVLDLLPNLSREALTSLFQKRLAVGKEKSLSLWLEGMIPKKLAYFIIENTHLSHIKEASSLGAKEIKKMVFALKSLRLHVKATKGFESAEVCAGGVDVSELESKNLMSKKIQNLYFCGEVLDIDGDCGGFNLHFAWASGYLVGQSL